MPIIIHCVHVLFLLWILYFFINIFGLQSVIWPSRSDKLYAIATYDIMLYKETGHDY